MAAVFDAQRTGRGRDVDVNLYDVALAYHNYRATWYLTEGVRGERTPDSGHPSIVPFQFFPTADGYIAIACAKEKFFRALIQLIDLEQLATDERFSSFEGRRRNREALLEILGRRFRERTTAQWLGLLRGRVPAAPVRSMESALDRRELAGRGMLASYEHSALGTVTTVGLPIKVEGYNPVYRPAPLLDGDRLEVLRSAGYSGEDIERLTSRGAFGPAPTPAAGQRQREAEGSA
jgi:crotonobetainyl-CoA:carnitine CoA-transferase CaiB-like acyl-CoA transferase